MGKSAPAAPDPVATAQAQGQMNQETARTQARLNNPNTYGPGGAIEHTWGPDDTAATYTYLTPGQQRIYDTQTKLTGDTSQAALDATGRMQALLGTGVDTSSLPAWNNGPTAAPALATGAASAGQGVTTSIPGAGAGITTALTGAGKGITSSIGGAGAGVESGFSAGAPLARQGTEDYGAQRDAVTAAILAREQPQFDRDRQAMEARLAAQGFTPGTEAYRQGADEINRSMVDARNQAVLAGGQEQSRLFGLDQSRLGFNNAAGVTETNQANAALTLKNQAQAQGFGQRAQEAAFGNAAQAQGFGQGAQAAQFANDAQQQGFAQRAQDAAFGNAAQGQVVDQQFQQAGFTNSAANQSFNEQLALAQNDNQNRGQQLAEKLQLRAQPINEVSALFGLGNGVSMPQQAVTSATQVAAPDYQGLVSGNYKAAAGAAAANNAATAQGIGSIASVAAIAI